MNKKLVTHSGSFHADDIVSYSILSCVFPHHTLVRSRDEETILSGDIVFDVGRLYDKSRCRFDHHQENGPKRKNGELYSSAGLIWDTYGSKMIRTILSDKNPDARTIERIWSKIDSKFIRFIDLVDNGQMQPSSDNISVMLLSFNPSWVEQEHCSDVNQLFYYQFLRAAFVAKEFITRMIYREYGNIHSETMVLEYYKKSPDKRVLELPVGMPWQEVVTNNKLPTIYVLHPNVEKTMIMVNCVPVDTHSFQNIKSLPSKWSAKDGEELALLTGVVDAVFCHRQCFVGAAKSWDGARELARLALNEE